MIRRFIKKLAGRRQSTRKTRSDRGVGKRAGPLSFVLYASALAVWKPTMTAPPPRTSGAIVDGDPSSLSRAGASNAFTSACMLCTLRNVGLTGVARVASA